METLPFEIAETAHALRRAFDRRASSLGVTRAQWKVMFRLNRTPGLRQVELADLLDVEPITLCRIVDRLEEAGLVERQRDPADRRAWKLRLTKAAEPLVTKLHALAEGFSADVFADLDPAEIERARVLLGSIRNNLSGMAPRTKASA